MKNLDLTKILKVGQEVYSPVFGYGIVVSTSNDIIDEKYTYPILVRFSHANREDAISDAGCAVFREIFTKEGKYTYLASADAECVLFPSKENRDWGSFQQK
ncbi:MAG: hypothetical protein IJR13_07615 [Bacteroidales bacterium]|nr:hypothetical protein [Bacteroidales bacterium]